MVVGDRYHSLRHHYHPHPHLLMPNKYNIRANSQVLDNFIRKRAWIAFRDHFCEYSLEDARAIVEYHNNTTHRTLLHSLCDISNSSPPPPDLLYVVAESSPRSLLLQDSVELLFLHV
mmetsp:Transcript_14745/g.30228  ORF Transcript_14745/g.30228 Transcript_14745/m.30228 type:complete len:117 (+) Transcript_14745:19-369(+)